MQMYNAVSPREMKDLILRRLGAPIINVEVSEDQIYDSISRALELYIEYHPDGQNKAYTIIVANEEQVSSGVFQLDLPATAVTKLLQSDNSMSGGLGAGVTTGWMGDLMNGINGTGSANSFHGGMSGGGLSYYYQLMSYKNMMMDMMNPLHDYWYNAVNKQMRVNGNLSVGDVIVIEAWVPSALLVSESATGIVGNRSSKIGSFDDVSNADLWNDPYGTLQQNNYIGNPSQYADQSAYGVRWVKDMSVAFTKQLNGIVLKKQQGLQLPGGITIDGQTIYQEATEEIERLREELMNLTVPLGVYMG